MQHSHTCVCAFEHTEPIPLNLLGRVRISPRRPPPPHGHNRIKSGTISRGWHECETPELGSALGIRQLAALPDWVAVRAQVLRWYVEGLTPLGFEFQVGLEGAAPPFVSTVLPRDMNRDELGFALHAGRLSVWRRRVR